MLEKTMYHFHHRTFYKVFPEDLTLHGFKYSLGLNIMPKEKSFNFSYFSFEDFFTWISSEENVIGIIRIPLGVDISNGGCGGKYSRYIYIEKFISLEEFMKSQCTYDMALKTVRQKYNIIKYIPDNFKTVDLCEIFIRKFYSLKHIPDKFKTLENCLYVVTSYGYALEDVPNYLKTPEICFAAVSQCGQALEFVPDQLKTTELLFMAIFQNGHNLKYAPEHLKTYELCHIAVTNSGGALEFVPDHLKTPELCLTAVTQNGISLKFIPEASKSRKICLKAVKNNKDSLRYVPKHINTLGFYFSYKFGKMN